MSRREALRLLGITAAGFAAKQFLGPGTAIAEEITPPPIDVELERVLNEEAAASRRESPPKYVFFGDGDHRNPDGRFALAEKTALTALAEKGVKAIFIEAPEASQDLIDRVAAGRLTEAGYKMYCQKYGFTSNFDPPEDPQKSMHSFHVKLIKNCAALGISVYAADTTAGLDKAPKMNKFLTNLFTEVKRAEPKTVAEGLELSQKYVNEHKQEQEEAVADWVKYRLKQDASVAQKIKSIMEKYDDRDSAAVIYGIVHADHNLDERLKDTTPSIIDKLGGESNVAKICLPNPAENYGTLSDWRKLSLQDNKFVGDQAPTTALRPAATRPFNFLRPRNER